MTIQTNEQMRSAVYKLEEHYHGIANIPYTDELFVEVLTYNREHAPVKGVPIGSHRAPRKTVVSPNWQSNVDRGAEMYKQGAQVGVIAGELGVSYEAVRSNLGVARKLGILPRGRRSLEVTATANGVTYTGSKKGAAEHFGVNYRYFTGYEGTGKVTWHATGNYVFEERGQTDGL